MEEAVRDAETCSNFSPWARRMRRNCPGQRGQAGAGCSGLPSAATGPLGILSSTCLPLQLLPLPFPLLEPLPQGGGCRGTRQGAGPGSASPRSAPAPLAPHRLKTRSTDARTLCLRRGRPAAARHGPSPSPAGESTRGPDAWSLWPQGPLRNRPRRGPARSTMVKLWVRPEMFEIGAITFHNGRQALQRAKDINEVACALWRESPHIRWVYGGCAPVGGGGAPCLTRCARS